MKTLDQWFEEYAVSHQHQTNKSIHYVCVPLIFFSIVGLLMSIPTNVIPYFSFYHPLFANWATIALLAVMWFYLRLSLAVALQMFVFSLLCMIGNYMLSQFVPLSVVSMMLFVLAWIGQFYGHHLEGKKPSFLKDLQFLLIGPAWVINKIVVSR